MEPNRKLKEFMRIDDENGKLNETLYTKKNFKIFGMKENYKDLDGIYLTYEDLLNGFRKFFEDRPHLWPSGLSVYQPHKTIVESLLFSGQDDDEYEEIGYVDYD